jgi:hypothetical protein
MGRTPTPDGKRNGWSVKLSDAKSGRADELRGAVPRALWLEALIDAAIASAGGGTVPHVDFSTPTGNPQVEVQRGRPARDGAARNPSAPKVAPVAFREPAERGCPPHPKARVIKGLCRACGRQVGSEKVA